MFHTGCNDVHALGIACRYIIGNEQITASSFYDNHEAFKGRLHNDENWAIELENSTDPWIQLDLLQQTLVTGIITQGSANREEWVTELQIQYGDSKDMLFHILENDASGGPKVSTLKCPYYVHFAHWP